MNKNACFFCCKFVVELCRQYSTEFMCAGCWLCVKWIDDHFMRLADIRRQIDTLIYGWNKRLDKLLSFSAGNVAVVGNNESFRRFFFVSASSGCGVVVFGDACECVATNRVCVCHHCGFTFFIRLELWCIHSDVCTPRRITMWSKSSFIGLHRQPAHPILLIAFLQSQKSNRWRILRIKMAQQPRREREAARQHHPQNQIWRGYHVPDGHLGSCA